MTYVIEVFRCYCATEVFIINGVNADSDDFGSSCDESPDTADDYSCGNRVFSAKLPTQEVLDKYGINVTEYNEIAHELEDKLSFGCCGWCS